MTRQIILDTETTGLEPDSHRIIEIGCIEIVNRRPTGNRYHQYLNPDREVDAGAVAVHGLSNEFLADKPRFNDIVDDLLSFLKGAELIIHNAAFDVGSQILSRAADISADLIVMGAYGHARVRELVLGGVTRSLLEAMTVPVLMSH